MEDFMIEEIKNIDLIDAQKLYKEAFETKNERLIKKFILYCIYQRLKKNCSDKDLIDAILNITNIEVK